MAAHEAFLKTEPSAHVVQLYDAKGEMLAENIARYAREGLESGGGVLLVAAPAHTEMFLAAMKRMGIDVKTALHESRITSADAAETLTRFMVEGYPDAARFERSVGSIVRAEAARNPQAPLRVYGEMVGLLWEAGQFPAALRLEQLWNRLRKAVSFDLFCGYPIDIFGKNFNEGVVDALLCAHTHVLPSTNNDALESAIRRAMHEVFGTNVPLPQALSEESATQSRSSLPRGEALVLWLRKSLLKEADDVLLRARGYYLASA